MEIGIVDQRPFSMINLLIEGCDKQQQFFIEDEETYV